MTKFATLITATAFASTATFAFANTEDDCPPALDGNNFACLQADMMDVGDTIEGGVMLENAESFGLDGDETYYRVGDYVYHVDAEGKVIDVVGTMTSQG